VTADEAHRLLVFDTCEEEGTFFQLRLGNDPGNKRTAQLRLALRVLWRHWRAQDALPYDIAKAAGVILHFRDEACRNLRESNRGTREDLLSIELSDLVQGAFDLLAGSVAETWTVRRKDLGE